MFLQIMFVVKETFDFIGCHVHLISALISVQRGIYVSVSINIGMLLITETRDPDFPTGLRVYAGVNMISTFFFFF